MSLNRHLIFARLLRSRSAGTIRKLKATGAYTTPRDIMPMTSAALLHSCIGAKTQQRPWTHLGPDAAQRKPTAAQRRESVP